MKNVVVRQARDEDIRDVKRVVREAFYRPGKNQDFNEWEFVDQVTRDPGFIPELCFRPGDWKDTCGIFATAC